MLLGARAIIYTCPDLTAGKAFYEKVCGYGPHHDTPHYVGFAVSAFELGLVPDGPRGEGGTVHYWGVADVRAEAARLAGLGMTPHGGVEDVGDGILVAEFRDPFGNRFAVMQNPNYDPAKAR
jgi:predicted enzyme related to lactoylglutathione lyase